MNKIIHLNESELKSELSELVRGTVEETLDKLLDAEADWITGAKKYERTEERKNAKTLGPATMAVNN